MNTITFEKLYAKELKNESCYISIPFAKGVLKSPLNCKIYDGDFSLPLQQKVTAYHDDGSIKYLFNRFLCDIPANSKKNLFFEINDEPVSTFTNGISVITKNDGFIIDNQSIKFEVNNNSSSLFSCLLFNNTTYTSSNFVGPHIEINHTPYDFNYIKWDIEEAGDLCVVLSCKGYFGTKAYPADIKLTCYLYQPNVDISIVFYNSSMKDACISNYYFEIILNEITRSLVASSNYKTDFCISENGKEVRKDITAMSLLNQSNEHFAEVFYGTFFADITGNTGILATIFQAHQNFPKAISASNSGLKLYLVPDNDNSVIFPSGMAREQRFQLYFHSKEMDLQDINHISTVYQMPNRPILDNSVYEEAGIFPDIFVHDKNPEAEWALINCADSHSRGYGILNFGDTPDPNYTNQGRGNGELIWTNNEYDFPHACFLMFIKTGIRRYLDYLLVSANHQIDVDVCHFSDNPLIYGGQWEHTNGHNKNGVMVCSHQWVEGILDCYHVTGDKRYYDTAIGIGDNILRLLDTPMYQNKGSFNARETGWALRSLTALYVETGDDKWTIKSDWIVNQFKEWFDTYGGWLAPYMDNVVIRVPFMISVAIGSLMRYYRAIPDEQIKEMIIKAVDDMIENCLMDNGLFFYKELPSLNRLGNNPLVLEALSIAYELTGNKKYLIAGKTTFTQVLKNLSSAGGGTKRIVENTVLTGNTGSKQFAQSFIPVATFYKALEKASLY